MSDCLKTRPGIFCKDLLQINSPYICALSRVYSTILPMLALILQSAFPYCWAFFFYCTLITYVVCSFRTSARVFPMFKQSIVILGHSVPCYTGPRTTGTCLDDFGYIYRENFYYLHRERGPGEGL